MSPKVSIILMTYNQVDYVEEALKSVFQQTYQNWELIISDNGSTDGTDSVLETYKDHEKVTLILNRSNDYVTRRANEALEMVSGEYISILYGDDYYLPTKIEEQIECFKGLSSEWGVVHGPGFSLNQKNDQQSLENCLEVHGNALQEILDHFYTKGFINPISPLARKSCYDLYPFYKDLFTEGESIYMRFSIKFKFFYLENPLVVMRVHDKNARWYSKKNLEVQDTCLERLKDSSDFPSRLLNNLTRLRTYNYSIGAWENLRLSENIDVKYIRERIFKSFKLDSLGSLSLRNILALILSYCPNIMVITFNKSLDYVFNVSKQNYLDESFINNDRN